MVTQFLLPCYKGEKWVPSDDPANIEMTVNICNEAGNTFLWSFEAKTDMTMFFDKNVIMEKDKNLEKKNEEVDMKIKAWVHNRYIKLKNLLMR